MASGKMPPVTLPSQDSVLLTYVAVATARTSCFPLSFYNLFVVCVYIQLCMHCDESCVYEEIGQVKEVDLSFNK